MDYKRLRVFGCLCFASTISSQRLKFHPRAKPYVFVGYPPGVKGHKLYDIVSKSLFISRDVVFHEHLFPFQSIPHHYDSVDPFPDIVLPEPACDVPYNSAHNIGSTSIDTSEPSSSHTHLQPESSQPLIFRRTTRITKPPSYLRDFHCNLLEESSILPNVTTPYPLQKYLSYKAFSPAHCHYLLNVSSNFEPQYYHESVKNSHWREAMAAELEAME